MSLTSNQARRRLVPKTRMWLSRKLPKAARIACALLCGLGGLSAQESPPEKEKVASFDRVALALMVFAAEKACKGFVLDQDALNHFLTENGITGVQLSA